MKIDTCLIPSSIGEQIQSADFLLIRISEIKKDAQSISKDESFFAFHFIFLFYQ